MLIVPACKPEVEDANLPEQIAAKLKESDANLRNHKSDEAAEGYKWVLENEPGNVAALTGLGKVELEREDYAAAVDPLEKAVAANGEDASARASLGRAYAGTKDWAKAAEHLGKAWELDQDTEQYGLEYGVALRETGKLDEAATVLTEVGEINPKLKYVYRELGKVQLEAKELDKALRTFMKAQTQWAGDQDAFAGAAMVYEAQGDVSKSIDQWSQYIQQDCCSTYSKDVAQPKLAALKKQENEAGNLPADG
ncbi:tetratricopeptide repeat protein [Enhygromyxa salina]|nr:tetratricopeptide repeat protein [Enhygromyxa salina]